MYAMLLLRTGKTVGMEELTRLAARRGDVVGTVALLVFLGVSLKKVTNVNKILQKGTRPYGLMDAIHGHFDIMTSAQIDKRHFNIFVLHDFLHHLLHQVGQIELFDLFDLFVYFLRVK